MNLLYFLIHHSRHRTVNGLAKYPLPRVSSMRGSRKFCQRGSNFDGLFLYVFFFSQLMRGSKYCDKRAIIGPPAKRLYMTFHWRADRGPIFMLNWFANLTFPSQHANSANHRPLSETFACGSMMARVVSFQSHSIVSLVGRWWPDYVLMFYGFYQVNI